MIRARDFHIRGLEPASFDIPPSERLVLVCPSAYDRDAMGAAMATFAGFTGELEICGVDARERSLDAKGHLGYAPAKIPAYPEMKLSDYMRFIALTFGIPRRYIDDRIDAVASVCDLNALLNKRIGLLGDCEKTRACLGQALLSDPEALIWATDDVLYAAEIMDEINPAMSIALIIAKSDIKNYVLELKEEHVLYL